MPAEPLPQTRLRVPLRTPHRPRSVVVLAAFACALALVPAAVAHVTATPAFVEVGVPTLVSFETPNERRGRATTSLQLEGPPGVELDTAPPPGRWGVGIDGRKAIWVGGRIEGTSTVAFPLTITAHTRAGAQTFRAVQGYDDGRTVTWETKLTVLPAAEENAPSQRLGRALAAGAVGLAVIAGSLLVLRRFRRR